MNKNLLLKTGVALILDAGLAGYRGYNADDSERLKTFGKALAWSGIVSTLPAVAGNFAGSAVSDNTLVKIASGVVAADALTCALETELVRTKIPGFGKIDVAPTKQIMAKESYLDFTNTTFQVLAFDAIDYYFPAEDSTNSVLPEINV